jgi:hypothetical protein
MRNAIIDFEFWRSDSPETMITGDAEAVIFGVRAAWIVVTGILFIRFHADFLRQPWLALQAYFVLPLVFGWMICVACSVQAAVRRKQLGFLLFTTDLTAWEIVSGDCAWLCLLIPHALAQILLGGLPFLLLCGPGVFAMLITSVNFLGMCAALVSFGLMLGVVCGPRTALSLALVLPPAAVGLVWAWWTPGGWLLDPLTLIEYCVRGGLVTGLTAALPYLLLWTTLTAAFLGVAAWRLRPTVLRPLDVRLTPSGSPSASTYLHRPPVGDDPLRWRERYAGHPFSLSRWLPRWLCLGLTGLASLVASAWVVEQRLQSLGGSGLQTRWRDFPSTLLPTGGDGAVFLLPPLVITLVFGSVALARSLYSRNEEHRCGIWEHLLLTDLTLAELVEGKWRGIRDALRPYWLAASVPALLVALAGGLPGALVMAAGLVLSQSLIGYVGATALARTLITDDMIEGIGHRLEGMGNRYMRLPPSLRWLLPVGGLCVVVVAWWLLPVLQQACGPWGDAALAMLVAIPCAWLLRRANPALLRAAARELEQTREEQKAHYPAVNARA